MCHTYYVPHIVLGIMETAVTKSVKTQWMEFTGARLSEGRALSYGRIFQATGRVRFKGQQQDRVPH
jgi:hypothetical protein